MPFPAILQISTTILVAVTLVPVLAHALELPGKLRLSREDYLKVQPIYYPGFTWAGFVEPAAILALLLLTILTPAGTAPFWLRLGALIALAAMHATYWLVTHPVNNFWLKDTRLNKAAEKFFGAGGDDRQADWKKLRDRWEYSHVARAGCAALALVLTVTALVQAPPA